MTFTFDPLADLAQGIIVNSPGTSGTTFELEPGQVAEFPQSFPFTIATWPANSTPTQATVEYCRVTGSNSGLNTLTVTRETTAEPERPSAKGRVKANVVAGYQVAFFLTRGMLEQFTTALNELNAAKPSTSGVVYVSTSGKTAGEGADGSSWAKAFRNIPEAISALPEGPEALGSTGVTPRVGTVEIGYGIFKVSSSARTAKACSNKATKTKPTVIIDPSATSADVGRYVFALDEFKNSLQGQIVASVNEGTHEVTLVAGEEETVGKTKEKGWGAKTPAEIAGESSTTSAQATLAGSFSISVVSGAAYKAGGGYAQAVCENGEIVTFSYEKVTSNTIEECKVLAQSQAQSGKIASGKAVYKTFAYHTLVYVTPAIVQTPGVKLRGRGKHTGASLKASKNFGTVIEDEGAGITIIVPPGVGEKVFSFVGMQIESLCVKGVGKTNTEAPTSPEAQAHGEREGGPTIAGFFAVHCAEIQLIDTQWQEHGYVGCIVGKQAVVTLHVQDSFFYANGTYNNVWTTEGSIVYGGLWLVGAPNQGVLLNNRYNANFGAGLIVEGGMNTVNDEHSHNYALKNKIAGFETGVGLIYTGAPANGNFALYGGWGEGNDNYEMWLSGNGIATITGYQYRGATNANQTAHVCPVGVKTSAGLSTFIGCEWGAGYWGAQAYEQKWLVEPGSGQLVISGCPVLEPTEGEAKGIKAAGPVAYAVTRPIMNGSTLTMPSQLLTAPSVAKEVALTANTAFQNTTGTDITLELGLVHEGASEVNIEVGATEGTLAKICGTIKMPTTGTTTQHSITVPAGWWLKIPTPVKAKIVGPTGTEGKAIARPR